MNDKEIKGMLQDIQDDLEKLKYTNTDVLFLASKNNRSVISGSMQGIAAMLLWNMIRYPELRIILELAIKNFHPSLPNTVVRLKMGFRRTKSLIPTATTSSM